MLEGEVKTANIEFLKHELDDIFLIFLGVSRSIGEQDVAILRSHLEFIEEAMVPHFFHIRPVLNHPIDDRPRNVKNTFLAGDLVPKVYIFLIHADHLTRLFGSADDGGEAAFGCIIACNTEFHGAGSIVDYEGGYIVVHFNLNVFYKLYNRQLFIS